MTVNIKDLVVGQAYEGFLWHSGKQRGVATRYWNGKGFPDLLGLLPHADDQEDRGWGWSFEPNVLDINSGDEYSGEDTQAEAD